MSYGPMDFVSNDNSTVESTQKSWNLRGPTCHLCNLQLAIFFSLKYWIWSKASGWKDHSTVPTLNMSSCLGKFRNISYWLTCVWAIIFVENCNCQIGQSYTQLNRQIGSHFWCFCWKFSSKGMWKEVPISKLVTLE